MQELNNITTDLAVERTHLANERTMLAVLRTGMTLLLGGLGMLKYIGNWFLEICGLLMIPVALVLMARGYIDYKRIRVAIERERGQMGVEE